MMARFPGAVDADVDDAHVPFEAFNWHALGVVACDIFKASACASLDCMLGAVNPPKVKVKKQAAGRKKPVYEPEKAPEAVDQSKVDDKNETSRLAEAMFERVVAHHGAPYIFFVLDPESFSQTIENMFSVAVLVGSGRIALRRDCEWGMQIQVAKGRLANGQEAPAQPKGDAAQMVLNMNYKMFEQVKQVVAREQCLTPHRPPINLGRQGGAAAAAAQQQEGEEQQAQGQGQGHKRAAEGAAKGGRTKKQRKG